MLKTWTNFNIKVVSWDVNTDRKLKETTINESPLCWFSVRWQFVRYVVVDEFSSSLRLISECYYAKHVVLFHNDEEEDKKKCATHNTISDILKLCTFDTLSPIIYSTRNNNVCNAVFDRIAQHNFYSRTLLIYTLNLLECVNDSQKWLMQHHTHSLNEL